MLTVNTYEAKTRLSALLAAVEKQHEKVVICRNGHPVAELHAVKHEKPSRLPPVARKLVPILSYDATEPASADEWPEDSR